MLVDSPLILAPDPYSRAEKVIRSVDLSGGKTKGDLFPDPSWVSG